MGYRPDFFAVTTRSLPGVPPSVFLPVLSVAIPYSFFIEIMASFYPDLEMVTVRGVTLLIDPSSLVDGCTYLLMGRDTVEPVDSVPTPSAALLLNLGRGDTSQERRRNSLQMGGLILNTISQSQFARNVPPMSAFLSSLARPPVSFFLLFFLL